MGKGRATFTNKGLIRGQNIFLMAKYVLLIDTFYSNYYFRRLCLLFLSSDYAYYFGRYLTQIRMEKGTVTFSGKGPMRHHYVLLMLKSWYFGK